MRRIKAKELNLESFRKYGTFADMLNPDSVAINNDIFKFFRDMVLVDLGTSTQASLSSCRIFKRPFIVDVTEYHSFCSEGILPLDGDILIHVGPASPPVEIPLDKFEAYLVPKGTMVVIRPGVWHHAPFTVNNNPANVLIVLPERIYANDCTVFELEEKDKITIKT